MFFWCSGLTSLDLSGFDTSKVTNMNAMFDDCSGLTSLDLSGFDTSQVTDIGCMFDRCSGLKSLDVSGFDTSKVTNMNAVFAGCSGLTSLDVSGFDTSKVKNMNGMFAGCSGLTSLDLSGFDTSKVTDITFMLDVDDCSGLTTIKTPCNLRMNVSLPYESDRPWRMPDGTVVTQLPRNLDHSVILQRLKKFADVVKEGNWQYPFVLYAYEHGLMNGKETYEDGTVRFDPNATITRAEFVQTLYSSMGRPDVPYTDKFTDVADRQWFAKAVLWAYSKGITAGNSENSFGVNDPIQREQMALMLFRYVQSRDPGKAKSTGTEGKLEKFQDADTVSPWAKTALEWAVDCGVIAGSGDEETSYCINPQGNATRAECAAMLFRVMSMFEE